MRKVEKWRVSRAMNSLREAALKYAEADSDEEFKYADIHLRRTAARYVERKRKYERRQGV